MISITVLAVIGAIQVVLTLFLFSNLVRNKNIEKLIYVLFIISAVFNLILFLYPIKVSADKINDCVAFYLYYIPKSLDLTYNFSFTQECNFDSEKINKMSQFQPKINPNFLP
jgi:hypothetical protein